MKLRLLQRKKHKFKGAEFPLPFLSFDESFSPWYSNFKSHQKGAFRAVETKKRFAYIDLAKLLAIMFVCLYHFGLGEDLLQSVSLTGSVPVRRFFAGILSTCVPLFFMANGALLLNKPLKLKAHYRGLLTLTIQYVIWRVLTILLVGLATGVDFSLMTKTDLLNLFLLDIGSDYIPISHFWFIPLFVCVGILFPFFKAVFDREDGFPMLAVLAGFIFVCSFLPADFEVFRRISPLTEKLTMAHLTYFHPFSGNVGAMCLYFLLGGLLHQDWEKARKASSLLCAGMIVLGMTMLFGTWYLMSRETGISYDNIYHGYGTTGTLLCTVGMFLLAMKAEEKLQPAARILRLFGSNTLTVYYLHWILGFFLLSLPGKGLRALLLVIVCTLIGEVMKKVPMIGKLFH